MDGVLGQSSFDKSSSYVPQSPKKSRRLIFIIFVVILIGALVFGGKRFFGGKSERKDESSVAPTPTIEKIELPTESLIETPIPTVSLTPEPTAAPTAKPTVNPVDKATGLDRSTLSVEVQNGSGEVGAASKASEVLKTFGYHVVAIGNADNFNYENTTIKVKSDKSDFLDLLKKDLGFSYTISTTSADLTATSSADALVIVGK